MLSTCLISTRTHTHTHRLPHMPTTNITATANTTTAASPARQRPIQNPESKIQNPIAPDLAIVLHGLNVTHHTMLRLARALERDGYRVVNRTYPSRTMPLDQIATEWLPRLLAGHDAPSAPRLHFVTHSMGGIIVRLWLQRNPVPKNLGRIVMITPPNQGSEIPDHFRNTPFMRSLFRRVASPNAARLGTDATSVPVQLSHTGLPPAVDLGIIAGNRPLNPLFLPWFKGESDGTVSVASTRLPGMRDHIIMPHSHTGILARSATAAQVLHFLRNGKFHHA